MSDAGITHEEIQKIDPVSEGFCSANEVRVGAKTRKHNRLINTARPGHAVKLTETHVLAIRRMAREGMTRRAIAGQFQINQSTVTRIINGKAWTWLTDGPSQLSLLPKEAA